MHLGYGDSCLQTHRQCQIILRQHGHFFRTLLLHFFQLVFQLLHLGLAQRCRFKIFFLCHLCHLVLGILQLYFEFFVLTAAIFIRCHLGNCCRLINHVNHFVRHKTIINIPPRHINCRFQHFIRYFHSVMLLIMPLHALQNLICHLWTRLFHHHRLETPRKCLVFLNIFAILIQSRGANQLNLSPRQCWLQNIRRVHRAFTRPRAHQQMQLINE